MREIKKHPKRWQNEPAIKIVQYTNIIRTTWFDKLKVCIWNFILPPHIRFTLEVIEIKRKK